MEVLGFKSEARYRKMEENEEECPFVLIDRIQDITGVNPDWLEHGKDPMYQVQQIYWPRASKAIQQLVRIDPKSIYVAHSQYQIGLCVHTGDFRYQLFDMGVTRSLWRDARRAPQLYVFFYALFQTFGYQTRGQTISKRDYRSLYAGNVHPYSIMPCDDIIYSPPRSWVEDFLDLWDIYSDAEHYSWVYDKQFIKMQEITRRYEAEIAEMLGIEQEEIPDRVRRLGLQAIQKLHS